MADFREIILVLVALALVSFVVFLLYKSVYDLLGLNKRDVQKYISGLGGSELIFHKSTVFDHDNHFPNKKFNFGDVVRPPLLQLYFLDVTYTDASGQRVRAAIMVRSLYFKKCRIEIKKLENN